MATTAARILGGAFVLLAAFGYSWIEGHEPAPEVLRAATRTAWALVACGVALFLLA